MKLIPILLLLVFIMAFHEYAGAQYRIPQSVFGSGGTPINNGSYRVNGTVGQAVIGVVNNLSHLNEVGFWYQSGGFTTGVAPISNSLPTKYRLFQNYPNPFNPSTTIEFALPKSAFVTLKVYNLLGAEVTTLVAEKRSARTHRFNLDAWGLASGVYLYRLEAALRQAQGPFTGSGSTSISSEPGFVQVIKLALVKQDHSKPIADFFYYRQSVG